MTKEKQKKRKENASSKKHLRRLTLLPSLLLKRIKATTTHSVSAKIPMGLPYANYLKERKKMHFY